MRRKGRDGSRVTVCIRQIFLRILVLSMVGKNTPSFLDLQNLASETSCVAAAVQAVAMPARFKAGGVPGGHCELLDADW